MSNYSKSVEYSFGAAAGSIGGVFGYGAANLFGIPFATENIANLPIVLTTVIASALLGLLITTIHRSNRKPSSVLHKPTGILT